MQQGTQPPTPGGYAAPPGYHQPLPNEPNAITSLVLGILGVVLCGILAPFAWNLGKKSLENIRANPHAYTGEGLAQAGYILGIIGTILLIVGVVFLFVYFVIIGLLIGAGTRFA